MNSFTDFDAIVSSGKKYQIIYADCPWQYDDKALAGNRGAECKYDVMDVDSICKLPVNNIADENCILFMWGTWPKLIDGSVIKVIESWGFTPKTCAFVWIKRYTTGTLFKGMGRWTRANSEFILIAAKGKPHRVDAGIEQIIETIPKKHSQKPDIFRKKIIQLCGDLPRIELFARTKIDGWDVFGNDKKLKSQQLEEWY